MRFRHAVTATAVIVGLWVPWDPIGWLIDRPWLYWPTITCGLAAAVVLAWPALRGHDA